MCEQRNKYRKGWRQTCAGKYNAYLTKAKERGYDFNLTKEEFAIYWQKPCYYCGDSIDTIGIDRKDNSRGYELDNIVSCCTFCNKAKNIYTTEYFLDKIKKIWEKNVHE